MSLKRTLARIEEEEEEEYAYRQQRLRRLRLLLLLVNIAAMPERQQKTDDPGRGSRYIQELLDSSHPTRFYTLFRMSPAQFRKLCRLLAVRRCWSDCPIPLSGVRHPRRREGLPRSSTR